MIRLCAFSDEAAKDLAGQADALQRHAISLTELRSVDGKNVREVELDLEANIPEELRPIAHHWLILHGRYVCTARKPKCETCGLTTWCRYYASEHAKPASSQPKQSQLSDPAATKKTGTAKSTQPRNSKTSPRKRKDQNAQKQK